MSDENLEQFNVGSYPVTPLEARAKVELAVSSRGGELVAKVIDKNRLATFREVSEVWVQRHGTPHKTARALANDCLVLDIHILPEIGDIKAAEVTKGDVIRMLEKVAAKPVARWPLAGKNTQRPTYHPSRVLNLTRSIFRWAVGHELLTVDPCSGVKPPKKVDRARERALSSEEIHTLWTVLESGPEKLRHRKDNVVTRPAALALLFSLTTGQRIGDVARIARDEIEFNTLAPTWVVPGDRTKNGKPNRIPLSRLAVSLIREAESLSGESKWLFPSPCGGRPIDPPGPTTALPGARGALGLADFRVHDLRRTVAKRMGECGIDTRTISLVLGYIVVREGTVTGGLSVKVSKRRDALDKWGARLEQIIAGKD